MAVYLALPLNTAYAAPREVFNNESPSWLRAVGKLHVPGVKYESGHQLNHREDCSATLVRKATSETTGTGGVKLPPANTIITAWHCLEFYRDLSKTITFTLLYGTQDSFSVAAYRLADGGGMNSDWAVLRLVQAVPAERVAALAVHPAKADTGRSIIMAGYSKKSEGERLSYDPQCSITGLSLRHTGGYESNCNALKGASGGAVVQLSADGKPLLAGVVSQGNGEGLSIFVPVDEFRSAIRANLK
ncbi:MAG: trypsin-like serine protease [Proteobacteria bacterium]|nr:trypsin-like serine protease [Pseudomonadota bacterium]